MTQTATDTTVHNQFRTDFYQKVVEQAGNMSLNAMPVDKPPVPPYISPNHSEQVRDFGPVESFKRLIGAHPLGSLSGKHPRVILVFDEAHSLTGEEEIGAGKWSHFSELCHVLRALNKQPLFCLFLSTTGKISKFTSAKEEDPSRRVIESQLNLIQPFTDLGFDLLAPKLPNDKSLTVEDITLDSYIAHLGRPL